MKKDKIYLGKEQLLVDNGFFYSRHAYYYELPYNRKSKIFGEFYEEKWYIKITELGLVIIYAENGGIANTSKYITQKEIDKFIPNIKPFIREQLYGNEHNYLYKIKSEE